MLNLITQVSVFQVFPLQSYSSPPRISKLYSLKKVPMSSSHLSEELQSISLTVEYLHELFELFCKGDLSPLLLPVYLSSWSFIYISVTSGYLFYTLHYTQMFIFIVIQLFFCCSNSSYSGHFELFKSAPVMLWPTPFSCNAISFSLTLQECNFLDGLESLQNEMEFWPEL